MCLGNEWKKPAPRRFRLTAKTLYPLLPSSFSHSNPLCWALNVFGKRMEETRSTPFPPYGENSVSAPSFFLFTFKPAVLGFECVWETNGRNPLRAVSARFGEGASPVFRAGFPLVGKPAFLMQFVQVFEAKNVEISEFMA